MIRRLKTRLIILTMISVFVLLAVLVAVMNIVNYTSLIRESDRTLDTLAGTDAPFDSIKPPLPIYPFSDGRSEMRYFSVWLDKNGNVLHADITHTGSVDESDAASFASEVFRSGNKRGFYESFRYLTDSNQRYARVIFLDCGHRLDSFETFLKVSTASAAVGFLVVLLVFFLAASRIIRPIAESYEKQKRFITDAGHELKTPLTIINANVDILEMELNTDSNESLTDIRKQTKRLTALTNDLVYLARMEETEQTVPMVEFPVSETVRESAEPFRARAQAEGKHWECDILPMMTVKGNDKAIRQLVSILLDNALKYSPAGGTVALRLYCQGHAAVLTVYNTCNTEITQAELDRVFDRFYRMDPSRNSDTGGHGIGLSIAKAIVHAHGGKISAAAEDGHSFCVTVSLPIQRGSTP